MLSNLTFTNSLSIYRSNWLARLVSSPRMANGAIGLQCAEFCVNSGMHIVGGIILFRMQLMIVIFSVGRYNQLLMKDDWYFLVCKLRRLLFLFTHWIWTISTCSFSHNKPNELKGKDIIIGEPRPNNVDDKVSVRKVILDKDPDGKESLKITVEASRLGGKKVHLQTRVGLLSRHNWSDRSPRPVRPVLPRADPELSSLSARKWILGRLMNQRCREELQTRNPPLVSCWTSIQKSFKTIGS